MEKEKEQQQQRQPPLQVTFDETGEDLEWGEGGPATNSKTTRSSKMNDSKQAAVRRNDTEEEEKARWPHFPRQTSVLVGLILFLGIATSVAFLYIGLPSAYNTQSNNFERAAADLVASIKLQLDRYVTAANFVHYTCRNRNFTRVQFRQLYEYLIHDGLEFKSVQFDPNVSRAERPLYEQEARQYYAQHYPHINYTGFQGFDQGLQNGLVPTAARDFYFPIHYQEPILGNEAAIDLDYYSHISRRQTLLHCFTYKEPAITDRLLLVKDPDTLSRCGAQSVPSYGIVLMHPGSNIVSDDPWPRDLASIVLCIPALLKRATIGEGGGQRQDKEIYIHDLHQRDGSATFLGGVRIVNNNAQQKEGPLVYLPEVEYSDLSGHLLLSSTLQLTNKNWAVTVVAVDGTYKPAIAFCILGSVLVLVSSVCIALWVTQSSRRTHAFNAMKSQVEHEKAALILKNTRQAARAERELNDFVAHEVRNPIASAMAACAFVKSSVNEKEPLITPEQRQETREDVEVIDSSLCFVNDLLRNMLDMHRSSAAQLNLKYETTDILHDILEPVGGMVYRRDGKTKVIVECERGLCVEADCLRLKQVVLNLARNANKFVTEGFIRLRGYVVDNSVRLSVEDSGCGIPESKRVLLFAKFQESLDVLSQGTGIGLYLCKNLVDLMGGDIRLDDSYDSGIPGLPGTRITIDLNRAPVHPDVLLRGEESNGENEKVVQLADAVGEDLTAETDPSLSSNAPTELPDALSVLFVDDDRILRRMFARSISKVAPGWIMREAGNGEAALRMLDEGLHVDLCFMDQYMSSIEKQLLGTETVAEMRARGAKFRIVGLSANDLQEEFVAAGANSFVIKPFPTDAATLKQMLWSSYFG